jgi:hypothetical protein
LALIRAAADYGARRGTSAPTGVGAGAAKAQASEAEASEATEATATEGLIGNTLGLEIALGAIRDAEAAGISLGSEALDELFRVS